LRCEHCPPRDELASTPTLIAERFLRPDSSLVLASALARMTKRIELMVAVHPAL